MKKVILVSFLILIGLFSCKTNKNLSNVNKMDKIDLPFQEKDFSLKYIVGISEGISPNLDKSKDIALATSRARISDKFGILIENVLESYSSQRNTNYYLSKNQQISIQTSIKYLKNIKLLDEKVFMDNNGKYHYWVVLGVNKEEMLDKIENSDFGVKEEQVDIEMNEFKKTAKDQIQRFNK